MRVVATIGTPPQTPRLRVTSDELPTTVCRPAFVRFTAGVPFRLRRLFASSSEVVLFWGFVDFFCDRCRKAAGGAASCFCLMFRDVPMTFRCVLIPRIGASRHRCGNFTPVFGPSLCPSFLTDLDNASEFQQCPNGLCEGILRWNRYVRRKKIEVSGPLPLGDMELQGDWYGS